MRHPTWATLRTIMFRIDDRFGGRVRDTRCGKLWDGGQAVCAELYGPDWQNHPDLTRADAQSDELPVPDGTLEAATRLADGECEWAANGG